MRMWPGRSITFVHDDASSDCLFVISVMDRVDIPLRLLLELDGFHAFFERRLLVR